MTDKVPEKKKAAPGWYPDPKDKAALRKWDGAAWVDEWKPRKPPRERWTPNDYLAFGVCIAIVGVILGFLLTALTESFAGFFLAYAVIGIASIVFTIGMVAKGVEVGIRASTDR